MRTARVFRAIWRVNGVLILVLLVLVGGTALVAAVSSAISSRRAGTAAPAVVMPATGEKLFFGSIENVEGSPCVLLPLEARRVVKGMSYGSTHGSETRNLLFYDAVTGATNWLRPDHTAVILDRQMLRENGTVRGDSERNRADEPVRWIRYELASADTNHDGVIDGEDERQVALSGPDGKGFTVVVDRIDEVLGYSSPKSGKLVVFFRRGESEYAGEIDLTARRLVRAAPLPKS